jgi:hypothetical protein
MGRLPCILLWCALLGAPIVGQDPSRTYFEERLLDRAPIIVRARFVADQSCFDVEVGAFQVKQSLRGETEPRVLVLGAVQLSKQFRDTDRLLFLKREASGCLYRVVDVIDLVDEADATEAFVRGFLALVGEVDPAKRRSGLKQLIADGLAMRSEFPRKLAVRELDRLARRVPPVYSTDELVTLAKLGSPLMGDEAVRFGTALDAAESSILGPLQGTQESIPRGNRRIQYVRMIQEFHQDFDSERRAAVLDQIAMRFGDFAVPLLVRLLDDEALSPRAALHLGALQHRAAAPRLLAVLKAGPKDPGPIIESLGAVGDDSAVQPVSRYLSTSEHFETAALALVRIGTPSAKRILDGFAAQLRRDPRQAPRVEVLERLRSKAFQDEDTERRLDVRGRYARE